MSGVKELREQVLESLYQGLLDGELDEFFPNKTELCINKDEKRLDHPAIKLIEALENARAADADLELRNEILAFDNANKDIDRKYVDRQELIKTLASSAVTLTTTVIWGIIFVNELNQTRKFEVDGTEVTAASRWLKQAFPKVRVF